MTDERYAKYIRLNWMANLSFVLVLIVVPIIARFLPGACLDTGLCLGSDLSAYEEIIVFVFSRGAYILINLMMLLALASTLFLLYQRVVNKRKLSWLVAIFATVMFPILLIFFATYIDEVLDGGLSLFGLFR